MSWLPTTKGSGPLRHLKAIAAEAARQPPPSNALLHDTAHKEATTEWRERWMEALQRQPAYFTLTAAFPIHE
jgi:hypothetical protein